MTLTTSIPPHLREAIFRSYEPLITRAVSSWPTETSFSIPTGTAPSTFVANFRNAILSLKNYKWETTVDCPKLWQIYADYVINRDETGAVWFRHRQPRGRPNLMTAEARIHSAVAASDPSLVPWRDSTQEEVEALCLLLSTKRLVGPYTITGQVPEDLSVRYDVGILYNEVLNQTIIT